MKAIAVLPQGLESEGAKELSDLGAFSLNTLKRAVTFEASTACFYRINLQALLPFRILREMAKFPCNDPKRLYIEIQRALDWKHWLNPSMSFRVDVSGSSNQLSHSHFTALQVKNAIIDLQRSHWGKRSFIDLEKPNLCIHLHISRGFCVLSLNGSAKSLHIRGYRSAMGAAPLKENLAAGLIKLSGWNSSLPLVDPLCGSGTLLIEAASIAQRISPGLNRSFLLEKWADFDPKLWDEENTRAKKLENRKKPLAKIIGCEKKLEIAKQAESNIRSAGLEKVIEIKTHDFQKLILPKKPGLIICNPPYGKRIGKDENLNLLYEKLGQFVKKHASGWQLWLLSGNPLLSRSLQMKCHRKIPINNGGIDCRLLHYKIN